MSIKERKRRRRRNIISHFVDPLNVRILWICLAKWKHSMRIKIIFGQIGNQNLLQNREWENEISIWDGMAGGEAAKVLIVQSTSVYTHTAYGVFFFGRFFFISDK